jgi:hypothetical protein
LYIECTAHQCDLQAGGKKSKKRAGFERYLGLKLIGPREVARGRYRVKEPIVRIAYLTLDDFNQHLALGFADEQGATLDVQACPDCIREREYDAVIYDPDSFPPNERSANLTAVLACPLHRPVAVHSYNFSPDQLDLLRRRGAVTARRLGSGVFARLLTSVRAARQQQTVA